MLRIDQIRLLPDEPEAQLPRRCARILRVPAEAIRAYTVLRRAIDARESLTFVYTVIVSAPSPKGLRTRPRRVASGCGVGASVAL